MKKKGLSLRQFQSRFLKALLEGRRKQSREEALRALEGLGYTGFYDELLLPTLRQIGDGWVCGEVSVAAEHRATALIREILEGVRSLIPKRDPLDLRCVASGLEGDQHDLVLRMFADLLIFDGWQVEFLGADTPTSALVRFGKVVRPQLFVVSATTAGLSGALEQCVAALAAAFPNSHVLVGGPGAGGAGPEGAHLHREKSNLAETVEEVRRLFDLEHRHRTLAEYLVQLGRKVQDLRRARGWSQSELAEKAEVDRTYLSSLENGKQNLSLAVAYRLAAALQIPLVSLLGEGGGPPLL